MCRWVFIFLLLGGLPVSGFSEAKDFTVTIAVRGADVDTLMQMFNLKEAEAPALVTEYLKNMLDRFFEQHQREMVQRSLQEVQKDPENRTKHDTLKKAIKKLDRRQD